MTTPTQALKIARDALADMIRAGKQAKVDLTVGIRDGDPVHPVSASLTFPLATAINALAAIDALAQPQPSAPSVEPPTLADVLDALEVFNRPKPSEDDGPWEGGHYIRVDHLPKFIHNVVCAWHTPPAAPAQAGPIPGVTTDAELAGLEAAADAAGLSVEWYELRLELQHLRTARQAVARALLLAPGDTEAAIAAAAAALGLPIEAVRDVIETEGAPA